MKHGTHLAVSLGAMLALGWVSAADASCIAADGSRSVSPILGAAADQSTAAAPATASSVVFHVPTITCPTCPLRVEASIRKAPGILDVAFNGQDVTVTYDPSAVSPDAIETAIEAGGDVAELAPA